MKVIVRDIDSGFKLLEIDDVKDVGDGACGNLLIQAKDKNTLYSLRDGEMLEIIKNG